jgi:nucleotide-binding universal stress UspA family protein
MIKSILVPARGSDGEVAAFDAALLLARAFSAHLDFVHVRPDAAAIAAAITMESGSAALLSQVISGIEEESDRCEEKVKAAYESFCAKAGLAETSAPSLAESPSALFRREIGSERDLLVERARAADLVVMARPGDGEDGALELIEAVLAASGRPLFLPPGTPLTALPQRVAIAWKGAPEAARAVAAAMPFLGNAKEVVILSVEEGQEGAAERLEFLEDALLWHGFRVRLSRLAAGGIAAALLAAAEKENALLVMGGYSHSRLRERVFGGVTRRVLESAPVPILMAH